MVGYLQATTHFMFSRRKFGVFGGVGGYTAPVHALMLLMALG